MVQEICQDTGIKGHKTNHSLRATGATQLYNAGVPEIIIQERTGHKSLYCTNVSCCPLVPPNINWSCCPLVVLGALTGRITKALIE